MNYRSILKFFLYLAIVFLPISIKAQYWQQVSSFPSTARDDGTSFVIGNKAYCGTGLTPWWTPCNDFYSFDMNTDTWSTIASLPPGKERQYASGFSSFQAGFILGGINGNTFFNDLWQYDSTLNNWTEKTPLPSAGRSGAACFVINNIAYIIGGSTNLNSAINEVWAYDLLKDTWQSKNNLPFGSRWRASATAQNNKGYLIFGRDENDRFCKELFEYNPILDSWTQISAFPANGRSYSMLKSMLGDLVLIGGLDTLGISYNDMWRFNTSQLIWQQLNPIPSSGRRGGMCFNNSSAIYYTTGINQTNERLKETWKCINPTGIAEHPESKKVEIYPNPANEFILLKLSGSTPTQNIFFELFDILGNLILKGSTIHPMTRINLSGISKGLYFVKLQDQNSSHIIKLIKQ